MNEIYPVYQPELFITNDKLYAIIEDEISEIPLEGTGFFTLRTDFNHPFHEILDYLVQKNGGVINKPTFRPIASTSQERNKFFGIIGLYPKREEFLQDIVIPYGIREENYPRFLAWIKENFNSKIVLKKDGFQCCYGISMIDFGKNTEEENLKRAAFVLDSQRTPRNAAYITPYHSFESEYRMYFVKTKQTKKIYSIKQKHLKTNQEELFANSTFRESFSFDWSCVPREKWSEIKSIIDRAYEMIEQMDFETGTLEFGITQKGAIVFFEVNPMGSPMVFGGEDKNDIHEFYMDLFDLVTHNTF